MKHSACAFALFAMLAPSVALAGSQTYSTPGSHTFTVPHYTGTLSVTVNGAGGGGGDDDQQASPGGRSSFNGTVIGNGGQGSGSSDGTEQAHGEPGIASGGNVSNTTGGGAAGGAGTPGWYPGGNGGKAVSGYARGTLPASVSVVVGAGGAGARGGLPGANGSVTITWTDTPTQPTIPICDATSPTKSSGTNGSQTYSTPGSYTFTVPKYTGILAVEMWGGGGSGSGGAQGTPGGDSSWNNAVRAGGGTQAYPSRQPSGGTASGGDININGGDGSGPAKNGGNSPHGGRGGVYGSYVGSSLDGEAPGGGGAGEWGGGGGGAYAKKTYAPGDLSSGSQKSVIVGAAGGANLPQQFGLGGNGAPGAVKVSWTSSGPTLSPCAAGYELKNGKCVSTAVCNTCPAGQTLKTIPGARIAPTVTTTGTGGGGTPGSQIYSTPGTHTFTVPKYGSLTVEVWGGGGGGQFCYSMPMGRYSYTRMCFLGIVGSPSTFDSITAYGGNAGGGPAGSYYHIKDYTIGGGPGGTFADGTATGGEVNLSGEPGSYCGNSVGGGGGSGLDPVGTRHGVAPGGGGDGHCQGAAALGGGGGGYAKKTYPAGAFAPGSSQTVMVGAGGAKGGNTSAGPGAPGMVKITWTAAAASSQTTMTCPTGYTLQGSECVAPDTTQCVPDTTCPTGYHWDPVQNKCVLNGPNTCPAGTRLDPATNTCVPDTQCPAGQQWNGSACVCPAGTVWYQNRCQVGLCTPGRQCGADGNVYFKDLQCNLSLLEECAWGCANGLCNPPPAPQVITWKVAPKLVQKNATTGVFWNVMNVESCAVTSTNGDNWTSGQGGVSQGSKTSRSIIARTTFTLVCTPYEGATWTPQAPQVVNIVPVFKEE